jgi:hypothetical protein
MREKCCYSWFQQINAHPKLRNAHRVLQGALSVPLLWAETPDDGGLFAEARRR